jgi:hypothetical protein
MDDGDQLGAIKRLRQERKVTKLFRKIGTAVTRQENNRPTPPAKDIGYGCDEFAPQIDVEQGNVTIDVIRECESRF